MKKATLFGLVTLALLAGPVTGCAGIPESELNLDLKDIYYEKHHYQGTITEVLVVNVSLENSGAQPIIISPGIFRDEAGISYTTPIFSSRTPPEGECCKGIKRIVELEIGEKTDGYILVYEPVPAGATGLEVTVATDEPDIEPVTLSLPDASLIRVLEFFNTNPAS